MACPYFLPTEKSEDGLWPHPARLPLGCGWRGQCNAPGHEGELPSQEQLREYCNLGYAENCGRMPKTRLWDSVRFAARASCDGDKENMRLIQVRYVYERAHRPVEHGLLELKPAQGVWERPHQDRCLQRMAECFVETYKEKLKRKDAG